MEKEQFRSASQHLNDIIAKKNILKEICTIKKGEHLKSVMAQIGNYPFKSVKVNKQLQTGQLWLLTGRNGDTVEALNAGQSLDIKSEIEYDVEVMYGVLSGKKVSCPYRKLKGEYKELTFFEVDIDEYLAEVFGNIKRAEGDDNIVNMMFDISKEYLAEAAVAHYTGAKHWSFFNSGMDKRAYYRILDTEQE